MRKQYQPLGSMCMDCRYSHHDCSTFHFASMPVLRQNRMPHGWLITVRCENFVGKEDDNDE